MTTRIRLTLLTLVGATALTGASSAFGAYTTPRLLVTEATPSLTINFTQSAADDPTAKLTFYTPLGYTTSFGQAPGTTIGTVNALGTAGDLGGAALPLTGTVQVRAATGTYLSGTTQVPIAAAATACTGTATHTAFWVLILQAAGQTLELPVFVDDVTAAPLSAFAKAQIQTCLPPPDVPVGTPGRATFGFKLTRAVFTVQNVFTSTSSTPLRWRLVATPYTPARGTPNAAGTVETQSLVSQPRTVVLRKPTLIRSRLGFSFFRVAGTFQTPAADKPTIRILTGRTAGRVVSSAVLTTTIFGNSYSGTLKAKQTTRAQTLFLRTRATVTTTDFGAAGCVATFGAQGIPCLNATRAGYTVLSSVARIAVPSRK